MNKIKEPINHGSPLATGSAGSNSAASNSARNAHTEATVIITRATSEWVKVEIVFSLVASCRLKQNGKINSHSGQKDACDKKE